MSVVAMVVIAVIVVALPFVLAAVLNGRDRTDSRGRRVHREWWVRH